MFDDHEDFRVEIAALQHGTVKLELLGEMELSDLSYLETAVSAALSSTPTTVIFDISRATFIPLQGLLLLGATAAQVNVVIEDSRSEVGKRIAEMALSGGASSRRGDRLSSTPTPRRLIQP